MKTLGDIQGQPVAGEFEFSRHAPRTNGWISGHGGSHVHLSRLRRRRRPERIGQ